MEPRELAERLSERDLKILLALRERDRATPEELARELGYDEGPVMRSLYWLEERGLVESEESRERVYELGEEGEEYAERGLPELRVARALIEAGGELGLEEDLERAGVPKQLACPTLGWLRRMWLAEIKREVGETKLVFVGEEESLEEDLDQRVLEALSEGPGSVEEVASRLGEDKERG